MIEEEDAQEIREAKKMAKDIIAMLKKKHPDANSHVVLFSLLRLASLFSKSVGMKKNQFLDLIEICYSTEE